MTLIEQRDAYKQAFMASSNAADLEKLNTIEVLVLLEKVKPSIPADKIADIEEQQAIYTEMLSKL